jgi:hypothetical protein
MSQRFTRKDAERAFARLAFTLGKTWSDRSGHLYSGPYWAPVPAGELWTRVGSDYVATVGAWMLDYNPVYGGFVIHQMGNEGGGVSCPMGHTRKPAREFCEAVRFAIDALGITFEILTGARA